jgi:YceI-like protein
MHPGRVAILALATMAAAAATPRAQNRPIDTAGSTLTVNVYKAGLFSTFADNHVIRARVARGSISADGGPGVELTVRCADMTVLDPGLPADKRADVQTRMLGPDVLDSAKYPDITFKSSAIEAAGPDRWSVTGRLTIHGVTRAITFPVTRANGRYAGTVLLKQREFGIQPISLFGGTVKVKDELKVSFDILPR